MTKIDAVGSVAGGLVEAVGDGAEGGMLAGLTVERDSRGD